jgi:hypothetical protein
MMLRGGLMVLILSFMWPFGSKDWREAENVWRAGMQAEGNPQKDARRHDWLPYAFVTRTGTTNIYRVVHKGRLLPIGGGVDALAAYLRDIDAFHRNKLKATDLTELLKSFEAKPPTEETFEIFIDGLWPTATRTADKIELVVHVIVAEPQGRGTRPAPRQDRDVERWTLTIDRQHAAWTKQMTTLSQSHHGVAR